MYVDEHNMHTPGSLTRLMVVEHNILPELPVQVSCMQNTLHSVCSSEHRWPETAKTAINAIRECYFTLAHKIWCILLTLNADVVSG